MTIFYLLLGAIASVVIYLSNGILLAVLFAFGFITVSYFNAKYEKRKYGKVKDGSGKQA